MARRMVIVSTYPPRRCGLASYSDDLRAALRVAVPDWRVGVCAMDRDALPYGQGVLTTIDQDDPTTYRQGARAIAAAGADLVLIQHEYGIFGGVDGRYVLDFTDELQRLGVPYAVTLHTVHLRPVPEKLRVLQALCRYAVRVTVFTEGARRLALQHGIATDGQLVVVPHGAPTVLRASGRALPVRPAVRRTLDGLADARVLATFGLIGPGKGIEHAVAALPQLAAWHPDVHYLVAGATHPDELRRHGETCRDGLVILARRLGVADRLRFLDAFLTEAELSVVLSRTDVYVTPYSSPDQACSGALTFALAAGRPVVSAAYRYAEEMLAPCGASRPGAVVPCGDSAAIAEAVGDLLADPIRLDATRRAADAVGATLTWPAVAARLAIALDHPRASATQRVRLLAAAMR